MIYQHELVTILEYQFYVWVEISIAMQTSFMRKLEQGFYPSMRFQSVQTEPGRYGFM
jgi:hypothetical protein